MKFINQIYKYNVVNLSGRIVKRFEKAVIQEVL